MSEFGRLHDESITYIKAIQDYLRENYADRQIHKLEGKKRKDAEKVLAEFAIHDVSNESAFLERTGMTSKLVALDSNKGSEFLLEIRSGGGAPVFSSRICFDENGNYEIPHIPPPEPTQQPEFNEEDKVDHQTVALLASKNGKWLLSINLKHRMLTLPIGKVHPNESLIDGLCREMWEELGVKLDDVVVGSIKSFSPTVTFTKKYDFDGTPVNVTTNVFEIDYIDCFSDALFTQCRNMEPEKCGGLMWVDPTDIPNIVAATGLMLADCLDAAMQLHLDPVQVRTWSIHTKREE